jgi:hypothetical protein
MAMFDADEVQVSGNVDREKLPIGRYLVSLADVREVLGAYKGARFQLDFLVKQGPGAPAGTLKSVVIMQQLDASKRKKDNYKIQRWLACFGSKPKSEMKPSQITNEVYGKIVREQKVKSSSEQGTIVLKESFPAESGAFFENVATLVVKPYFNNKTKKKTSFYEFEPHNPSEQFEAFDPSKYQADESEEESDESSSDDALADARKAEADAEEDAPPPAPPEEEDPLTRAAKDGWAPNPKGKGWFWNKKTKQQLKEADLVAQYS